MALVLLVPEERAGGESVLAKYRQSRSRLAGAPGAPAGAEAVTHQGVQAE